jgi:hypothetical protein
MPGPMFSAWKPSSTHICSMVVFSTNTSPYRCRKRKQAYDYLYAVQQSMIGLPAQERLLLDQPVLLTKQSLILGESLSQPAFRAPMSYQLAFVTRDRAALATVKNNMRTRIRTGRRIFNGHLSCFPVSRLRLLDTRTLRPKEPSHIDPNQLCTIPDNDFAIWRNGQVSPL